MITTDMLKLLELLLIAAAVLGVGFWQLYKLRRERKPGAVKERSAFARRGEDRARAAGREGDSQSGPDTND